MKFSLFHTFQTHLFIYHFVYSKILLTLYRRNNQLYRLQYVINKQRKKLLHQLKPPQHNSFDNTQNNTKSSIQLGQIIQGQPQSPKFTKPYKPQSPNQFQIFKQYRDGNNGSNIAPSSPGVETLANSTEYQTAIDLIQQNKLYYLNILMKTKSYRDDTLQKIVSYQNPQLGNPERGKFIIGATIISMISEIKQEFIQIYQDIYEQAQQITGKNALTVNVICNYQKWNILISGYSEQDLIIQTAKLYEEGNDPKSHSHFKKLANLLHRYLRKICRDATAQNIRNQAYVLLESKEQFNQNNETIINLCVTTQNDKNNNNKIEINYQVEEKVAIEIKSQNQEIRQYQDDSSSDSEDNRVTQKKITRNSKLKLFGRFIAFEGSQYLTKSTPVDTLIRLLKNVSQNAQKVKRKLLISLRIISINLLSREECLFSLYELSLEQRKQILQNKFENDLGENTFLKFELKNKNKEEKIRIAYDEDRQVQPQKAKKTFISKNRVNNHNTPNQITQVQRLIIESKSKNYDQISLKTEVKVSSIKKKVSRIQKRDSIRKIRFLIDRLSSLTEPEKQIMLTEALKKFYSLLNIKEKQARHSYLFSKDIRYYTYRNFFMSQGFSYRSLTYRPLGTEARRNKEQVLQSAMRVDLIKNPFRRTFWHQNEQTKSQQMMFVQRIILQLWLQVKDMAFFAIRQKKMHLMEVIFLTSSSKPLISIDLCLEFKDKFVLLWIIAEFIKLSRQQRKEQIAPLDTYLQPLTAPDESN
ncbi:hypothetical protein ABPG72_020029 [Tetrahymena utriculariae]